MRSVLVINGPNLDVLGTREPEIYGSETLTDLENLVQSSASRLGLTVETFQSNHEGDLIEAVSRCTADGIVINPGALTHTSYALADALRSVPMPAVEVHISNIKAREPWRAQSVIGEACVATIYGRGLPGYRAALRHLHNRSRSPFHTVRYGPDPDNVGDLRRGQNGLVVLLHGGMWNHQFERDLTETLAVDLNQRGFHTWNLEYRRLGTGGGWPSSGHDVLMALDFIPQLGLDDQPVVVIGHSAGSYLGMWAAPRSRQPIDLCVGLAPVVDLSLATTPDGATMGEAQHFLLSGAPRQVDPDPISVILVHDETDEVMPFANSDLLHTSRNSELFKSSGGHFDLLDPSKPHWEWVVERVSPGSTYFSTDR